MSRQGDQAFEPWRAGFLARAHAKGISAETLATHMATIHPREDVLAQVQAQPEHALSLAEYMGRVMPPDRIRDARAAMEARKRLLLAVEERHGVPAEIVTAIWAVETDLGRVRGEIPVLEALATLAWASPRAEFFEAELIVALQIVQDGHVTPETFRGSWAGASGHGQFMPSSWRDFAVDHDGDGRADIWQDDPTDGLASIAAYLAGNGWLPNRPWGQAVHLPNEFDYGLSGLEGKRPVPAWAALGITGRSQALPGTGASAALILPAGHTGPAFLVFDNFQVLMRYNAALAYALAVGSLADQLADSPAPQIDWPQTRPLDWSETRTLQEALKARGFDPGGHDGLIGPDTRTALRAWQRAEGLPADGHADADILSKLKHDRDR